MSLNFEKCKIEGIYLIDNFVAGDERGIFVKSYNKENFELLGIKTDFAECYYSVSNQNVIRGMHFQMPPYEHEKLVYVANGEILDVIVDLRKGSKTFGEFVQFNLKQNEKALFIPKGCAHGFLSLAKESLVNYQVTTEYKKEADEGVLWNSFGFSWPVENPILSTRDKSFKKLADLNSPFI